MSLLSYLQDGLNLCDLALLINREAVGVFFAISGYHKLFNAKRHATLVETLRDNGIPLVGINQWFVPAVEFLGGLAVVSGILPVLAAAGMFTIVLVATLTDGAKRIGAYEPLNAADWCCDLLYLPEVLYGFMLLVVMIGGPGKYSLPNLLFAIL